MLTVSTCDQLSGEYRNGPFHHFFRLTILEHSSKRTMQLAINANYMHFRTQRFRIRKTQCFVREQQKYILQCQLTQQSALTVKWTPLNSQIVTTINNY